MKNLFICLFIMFVSVPVVAKIKTKHIAGTWTYTVPTDQGDLTGVLKFTKEKKGKLSGEVVTDDGMTIPMTKVEIREGDVVYFEIQPDYEVMQVSMTIGGDQYEGTVATSQGELPVSGKKQQ